MSTQLPYQPLYSRVHPLRGFNSPGVFCYVKREDELPFGAKGRKYRSLIPWIIAQKPKQVILLGGPFSNHVVALAQVLLENGIEPIPLFIGRQSEQPMGNQFLTSLLVPRNKWNWGERQKYLSQGLGIAQKVLELHPG